jgi:hypothetical protein
MLGVVVMSPLGLAIESLNGYLAQITLLFSIPFCFGIFLLVQTYIRARDNIIFLETICVPNFLPENNNA